MDFETFKKELHNLGTDTIHSATHILNFTLDLFSEFINTNKSLPNSFKEEILALLTTYQPEMSIFENFRNFLLQEKKTWTIRLLQRLIIEFRNSVNEQEVDTIRKLIIELKKLDISNIVTISYSKMVLNSILEYCTIKRLISVLVLSSPPKYEGVQFAKDLLYSSPTINLSLINDNLLGSQLKNLDKKTIVLIGCDSIFDNGSILNKSGSLMLAIMSKYFGIPFFVVGTQIKKRNIKFHQEMIKNQDLIDLPWYNEDLKKTNIKVINKYYDYVSNELITKIFY
jgi:translation initiation factor 2B subunit (eIF-2B alpha/beta/delta family)